MVVTFLAVLELMKIGKIHLNQEETFGEMDIETLEPEGQEDDLDLEQISDLDVLPNLFILDFAKNRPQKQVQERL